MYLILPNLERRMLHNTSGEHFHCCALLLKHIFLMSKLKSQIAFCDLCPSYTAWHYQEGFWSSIFVAAHQAVLFTNLSLGLLFAKAEQVQLLQPLLVSHELPASCHFGSPPLDLLQFLPIPLQLGAQTRHNITDGISPEPSTLLIAGHQWDIKPLITLL